MKKFLLILSLIFVLASVSMLVGYKIKNSDTNEVVDNSNIVNDIDYLGVGDVLTTKTKLRIDFNVFGEKLKAENYTMESSSKMYTLIYFSDEHPKYNDTPRLYVEFNRSISNYSNGVEIYLKDYNSQYLRIAHYDYSQFIDEQGNYITDISDALAILGVIELDVPSMSGFEIKSYNADINASVVGFYNVK